MANKKLTDLTELTTPADNDFLYIVDVSDTTESAQGTSKKIRKSNITADVDLQKVINAGGYAEVDGGSSYATILSGTAYDREVRLNIEDSVGNYSKLSIFNDSVEMEGSNEVSVSGVIIEDGNLSISKQMKSLSSNSTSIYIEDPLATTTLNFPAKTVAGDYTLATTDEVEAVEAKIPTTFSKIVYVNATSPTTATIFDLENPPVTNDNLLKNDTANLYIGTDASTWVYLTGTGYVTKTISSATSNFNTFGTTVDAGNSKTSHITRSGPVTLTGPLNLAVAKISTTPNTSAGSYDILTRNSSTTALEKKLVSDFLQTTGNQSFIGYKTATSTTAIPSGITLVNENNSTGATVANFTNSATSSINSTSALLVSNDNSGSATSAIQMRNNSSGFGGFFKNLSTGVGVFFENWSSGIGFQLDSRTGSTGDLIRFTKNASNTTVINHLGEITTMTPTASGQVSTKGYTDAKITQTITNGVTDKSPSEDAVFDALALKVSGSGTANLVAKFTATGTIANSTITDNGTNVGIGNASGSPAENLEVRTTGNAGFAMTRNASTNAARFYFKTGTTYNWSVGVRSSRNDYSIFNEVSSVETFTINATTNNALIGTTTDNGVAGDKLQVSGAIAVSSTIKAGATVRLKNYTVATLPAGVQGDTAYVTDALSPTYLGVLVGGGAVKCPVFYNGTAWVSH